MKFYFLCKFDIGYNWVFSDKIVGWFEKAEITIKIFRLAKNTVDTYSLPKEDKFANMKE